MKVLQPRSSRGRRLICSWRRRLILQAKRPPQRKRILPSCLPANLSNLIRSSLLLIPLMILRIDTNKVQASTWSMNICLCSKVQLKLRLTSSKGNRSLSSTILKLITFPTKMKPTWSTRPIASLCLKTLNKYYRPII